jgi:hypothetical protein
MTKISIAAAVALVAFVASPDASLAAKKSTRSSSETENCLGGGCTAVNPDRAPGYYNNAYWYKHNKKKKKTTH